MIGFFEYHKYSILGVVFVDDFSIGRFYGITAPVALGIKTSSFNKIVDLVTNSTGLELLENLQLELAVLKDSLKNPRIHRSWDYEASISGEYSDIIVGLDRYIESKSNDMAVKEEVKETSVFGSGYNDTSTDFFTGLDENSITNKPIISISGLTSTGLSNPGPLKYLTDPIKFKKYIAKLTNPIMKSDLLLSESDREILQNQLDKLPSKLTGMVDIVNSQGKTSAVNYITKYPITWAALNSLSEQAFKTVKFEETEMPVIDYEIAYIGRHIQNYAMGNVKYFGYNISTLRRIDSEERIGYVIYLVLNNLGTKTQDTIQHDIEETISQCNNLLNSSMSANDINLVTTLHLNDTQPQYIVDSIKQYNIQQMSLGNKDTVLESLTTPEALACFQMLKETSLLQSCLVSSHTLIFLVECYKACLLQSTDNNVLSKILRCWDSIYSDKVKKEVETSKKHLQNMLDANPSDRFDMFLEIEKNLSRDFHIFGLMPYHYNDFVHSVQVCCKITRQTEFQGLNGCNPMLISAIRLLRKNLRSLYLRIRVQRGIRA
jgi:hypothetical protein